MHENLVWPLIGCEQFKIKKKMIEKFLLIIMNVKRRHFKHNKLYFEIFTEEHELVILKYDLNILAWFAPVLPCKRIS